MSRTAPSDRRAGGRRNAAHMRRSRSPTLVTSVPTPSGSLSRPVRRDVRDLLVRQRDLLRVLGRAGDDALDLGLERSGILIGPVGLLVAFGADGVGLGLACGSITECRAGHCQTERA